MQYPLVSYCIILQENCVLSRSICAINRNIAILYRRYTICFDLQDTFENIYIHTLIHLHRPCVQSIHPDRMINYFSHPFFLLFNMAWGESTHLKPCCAIKTQRQFSQKVRKTLKRHICLNHSCKRAITRRVFTRNRYEYVP